MQLKKAEELRKRWGGKECEHPDFSKEYYLGSQTGDYICTQCGESFSRSEIDKILKQRNSK